jgi:hypothetical protein
MEVIRWKQLFDEVLFNYIQAGPDYMLRADTSIFAVWRAHFDTLHWEDSEAVVHAVRPLCF